MRSLFSLDLGFLLWLTNVSNGHTSILKTFRAVSLLKLIKKQCKFYCKFNFPITLHIRPLDGLLIRLGPS